MDDFKFNPGPVSDVDLEEPDDYDPAVDCWCQVCGAQFNGSDASGGHCRGGRYGGCCQSFRSRGGFDKHRTGRYEPNERRCLTPDELTGKGWTRDELGVWRTPAPAVSPWAKREAS